VYPVDLSCFTPATEVRPKARPLTIISTGAVSLRKGAPYLLEAFRIVHRKHPSARLLLTALVQDSAAPIVRKYADLPIDWSPGLPHRQLAERLRSADIFVLPSLEEGLVRTALEAMACGLPVVLTPNSGANDFVTSGQSGEVVPIRDAAAIAEAIFKWADIMMNRTTPPARLVDPALLSVETFDREFIQQLKLIGHLN
jgi:glycosyltransferase involved in cell wall biosynthesis